MTTQATGFSDRDGGRYSQAAHGTPPEVNVTSERSIGTDYCCALGCGGREVVSLPHAAAAIVYTGTFGVNTIAIVGREATHACPARTRPELREGTPDARGNVTRSRRASVRTHRLARR
jgi:hypothetical protein